MLEQYESALERRDLAALKRVWPSLGGTQEAAIRSDFRNSKRIEVEIVSPQIAVGDDTATVTFTYVETGYLINIDTGEPKSSPDATEPTTIVARVLLRGTTWLVEEYEST